MKKLLKTLSSIVMLILLLLNVFERDALSFFSEQDFVAISGYTGTVEPAIDNLRLKYDGVDSGIISSHNDPAKGYIRINTSIEFCFSLKNRGVNALEYSLILQIFWADELGEAGKLFVFESGISDQQILQSIQNNNFENAVIGYDAWDNVNIEDGQKGISAAIDHKILSGTQQSPTKSQDNSFDYSFKLFFFGDNEVNQNCALFHNKTLKINIIANADLVGQQTNWAARQKRSFWLSSVVDTSYPLIREISAPKTYFITQAAQINFEDFATASDSIDGDISHNLVISSSPQFDPNVAGDYTITYNVKNSLGYAATPLQIKITVWGLKKIVSGSYHSLVLSTHGKVYAFGYNASGQLGDGTTTYRSVPQLVEKLSNIEIIDIAVGSDCSYALSSDGQAYSWGRNANGRLGDNTLTTRTSPVEVLQPKGIKFKKISARFGTAGGITPEGDVYSWGYGGYGTLGNGKTSDSYIPTKANLSNIAELEMGYYNGIALTNEGVVYSWGDNLHGQLGTGAPMAIGTNEPAPLTYFSDRQIKIASISVGWYHMAAVCQNGELFTWGYGAQGRLGNNETSDKNLPQHIALSTPAKKVVVGYYHSAVMTTVGEVFFFGQNGYGKHGTGNTSNNYIPNNQNGVKNATDISLALDSSFVLSGSKTVFGMGYGGTGVLGTGNNSSSTLPIEWVFVPPSPQ